MSIPRPSKPFTFALIIAFAMTLIGSVVIYPALWAICFIAGVIFASDLAYVRPRQIAGLALALLLGGAFPWLLAPRIFSPDLNHSIVRMILGAVAAPALFLAGRMFMAFAKGGKKTKTVGSR